MTPTNDKPAPVPSKRCTCGVPSNHPENYLHERGCPMFVPSVAERAHDGEFDDESVPPPAAPDQRTPLARDAEGKAYTIGEVGRNTKLDEQRNAETAPPPAAPVQRTLRLPDLKAAAEKLAQERTPESEILNGWQDELSNGRCREGVRELLGVILTERTRAEAAERDLATMTANAELERLAKESARAEATRLRGVREASSRLMELLVKNVGDSADWPVEILTDDTAVGEQIAKALTELETALKESK